MPKRLGLDLARSQSAKVAAGSSCVTCGRFPTSKFHVRLPVSAFATTLRVQRRTKLSPFELEASETRLKN